MSDKDAGAAWNSLLEGASKEYIAEMLLAQLKESRKLKAQLAEANTKVEQRVGDLHAVSEDYTDAVEKLQGERRKAPEDAITVTCSLCRSQVPLYAHPIRSLIYEEIP